MSDQCRARGDAADRKVGGDCAEPVEHWTGRSDGDRSGIGIQAIKRREFGGQAREEGGEGNECKWNAGTRLSTGDTPVPATKEAADFAGRERGSVCAVVCVFAGDRGFWIATAIASPRNALGGRLR